MPAKGANPASAPMPSVFGDAAEQIRVMQDQQSGEIGVVDPRTLDACTDSCSSKLTKVFQECMPIRAQTALVSFALFTPLIR